MFTRVLGEHIKGETANKFNSSILVWNAKPEAVFNILRNLTCVKSPKLSLGSQKVMSSRGVNGRREAKGKKQPGASINDHDTDCILIS